MESVPILNRPYIYPYTWNQCQLLSTFCSIALFIFTNKALHILHATTYCKYQCVYTVVFNRSLYGFIIINQSSVLGRVHIAILYIGP